MQVQRNEIDVAWAAGLFEGEGCFHAYPRGKRGSGAQLRLGMTDRDVVERFAAIMGCGNIYVHKPGTGSHKPCPTWCLYEAEKVCEVIELLLPWLGARRRARALEVLTIAKDIGLHKGLRTHCPQGHPYSGDNLVLDTYMRKGKTYQARKCLSCRRTRDRARYRARIGS
jgi:hypothetical protein